MNNSDSTDSVEAKHCLVPDLLDSADFMIRYPSGLVVDTVAACSHACFPSLCHLRLCGLPGSFILSDFLAICRVVCPGSNFVFDLLLLGCLRLMRFLAIASAVGADAAYTYVHELNSSVSMSFLAARFEGKLKP